MHYIKTFLLSICKTVYFVTNMESNQELLVVYDSYLS